MSELPEQIRQLVDGSASPVTWDEITRQASPTRVSDVPQNRFTRVRSRRIVLVAAALLILVAAFVGIWTNQSQPSAGPGHHPASARPTEPKWQLTANLSDSQYQLASGNPNGGVSEVQCGGISTCFLSTFYGVGGNTSLTGATYVSHDSGHTWAPSTLPQGVATATAVSCVTSTWCATGGGLLDPSTGDPAAKKEMRDPELLTTTDAGVSWTMHAIPIPPDVQQLPAYGSLPAETTYWPGIVDAVSCTAVDVCNVVAHVLNDNPSTSGLTPDSIIFLRTTDGGATWTSFTLPERASESGYEEQVPDGNGAAMACPTASHCIVMSTLAGFNPNDGVVDTWRTTDSGTTWQESQVLGVTLAFPSLSCPDAENCWALSLAGALHSNDGGASWSLEALPSGASSENSPGPSWETISCASATNCVLGVEGMLETTNGGASWTPVAIPAGVGAVLSVSCQAEGNCIALAGSAQQNVGSNGGSLILTNGTSAESTAPATRQ